MRRKLFHFVVAASMAAGSMVSAVQAAVVSFGSFTGDFVTVGDPGNTADSSGYGAVSATFDIMKFEFTNQQYVQFLNTVDANGTNPNDIYLTNMSTDTRGGIDFTAGNAAGSKYQSKSNMGNKPVGYVSWFDAARVANWLHNGATATSSTETGAYDLGNLTTGTPPAKNPGARYWVPSEDEWYKAAFYKGGSTSAGYWAYATQFDTAPTKVSGNAVGDGSAGSNGNFANYGNNATWITNSSGNPTSQYTTVGTNGGSSVYGTFDMSGNANEWVSLMSVDGTNAAFRGGGRGSGSVDSSVRTLRDAGSDGGLNSTAFRIASLSTSPAAVPEPSMMVIGTLFGLGGLVAKRRRKV